MQDIAIGIIGKNVLVNDAYGCVAQVGSQHCCLFTHAHQFPLPPNDHPPEQRPGITRAYNEAARKIVVKSGSIQALPNAGMGAPLKSEPKVEKLIWMTLAKMKINTIDTTKRN